jgi:hypothetical protein
MCFAGIDGRILPDSTAIYCARSFSRDRGGGHMTAAPTSELQYVVRENQAIGFLLSAGPEGYQAFDADGLTLGHYKSEELAAKAIYEQSSSGPT